MAGELESPVKHEYVGGVVYAMAGARNLHNEIAVNIITELRTRLRGGPCRPYNSDTKVRLRFPTHQRFYYPDAMVVCRPNSPNDSFQDNPAIIVEVVSAKTRRIDEGEKRDAYLTISSLDIYLLVEQESPSVLVYRRTGQGFVREVVQGIAATIPLACVKTTLSLSEIYEGVEFVAEPDND